MREIFKELVPNQLGIKLEILTVFTGDLNSYSHHLSEFCSPTRTHSTPPNSRSGTTHYTDNNKRRCMDTIDLDPIFPLLNILQSGFIKSHCDALSPYHTNFLRNKSSREIKAGYGIDHFYVSKSMQQRIASFSSLDSLTDQLTQLFNTIMQGYLPGPPRHSRMKSPRRPLNTYRNSSSTSTSLMKELKKQLTLSTTRLQTQTKKMLRFASITLPRLFSQISLISSSKNIKTNNGRPNLKF